MYLLYHTNVPYYYTILLYHTIVSFLAYCEVDQLDLEASISWMSEKQVKMVRKRVRHLSSTIKRRRTKRNSEKLPMQSNEFDANNDTYPLYDNYFAPTLIHPRVR